MKHLLITTFMISAFAAPALALEAVKGAKADYQAAKTEVAAQLEALDKKIDELQASTKAKSTAAKERTLKEAELTREKLHADYEQMKADADSNWTSFKKKVARSLSKLNAKAQKALNE